MIARTWRGATKASDGDAYVEYLQKTGIREYKATPGNKGVIALRREQDGKTEFFLVSLWDGWEAVRAFAGPNPDKAVFYPEDDRFLVERDNHVDHYEVIE
jgi:heme-degrading monooxygenase HmoA